MIGTPGTVADQMEEWLKGEGCDGFNIMFPFVPEDLDDFVNKVVPELQRRGLFRREYEGKTLRKTSGCPSPPTASKANWREVERPRSPDRHRSARVRHAAG